MSDSGGNKTVFRPSPLQGRKQGAGTPPPPAQHQGWGAPPPPAGDAWGAPPAPAPAQPSWTPPAEPSGFGAMPTMSREAPQYAPALAPSRLGEDDVPLPATPREVRNLMLAEAGPVLALAAGMRAGRVRTPLPQFHRQATQAITQFERAIASAYPEETKQRAKYALCATIDDVAQNLPGVGNDGAEWARRSMVVSFFRENIGGDRFWQLVDDMLRDPAGNRDIIELYHACLAAGFEGRFRVMPDGKRRLHEIMARLQGALEHVRSLSMLEMAPRWRGEKAPLGKVGLWTYVAIAAAAAAGLLLLVYIVLRLLLMSAGEAPSGKLAGAMPDDRLRLSREGNIAPPGPSAQAGKLAKFLQSEIDQHLVTVEEDASTVRVRTTVGQLFKSGSDQLDPGRRELFDRIGKAIETQPGAVTVEGHTDSDKIKGSLSFPDNTALSQARADTVATIVRSTVRDGSRVTAKGMGDGTPIASNATADGKSQNRRVEVIVPRHD